jgi:hypothetical protein
VVELQHDWISLAAIHAGVIAKELQDMRSEVALTGLLGRSRLIAMDLTARTEVGGEACPAIPLVTVPEAVEELQRQVVTAAAAMTQQAGPPDTQPPDRQCIWWTAGSRRRGLRLVEVPDPNAHGRLRDVQLSGDAPDRPAELRS